MLHLSWNANLVDMEAANLIERGDAGQEQVNSQDATSMSCSGRQWLSAVARRFQGFCREWNVKAITHVHVLHGTGSGPVCSLHYGTTTFTSTIYPLQLTLHPLPLPCPHRLKPKQHRRHLPHLHLLAALRDPIPAKMPPDMLKRQMPAIPVSAMHLDRPVRRLRRQPVRPEIAHRDLVPQLLLDRHPGRFS